MQWLIFERNLNLELESVEGRKFYLYLFSAQTNHEDESYGFWRESGH